MDSKQRQLIEIHIELIIMVMTHKIYLAITITLLLEDTSQILFHTNKLIVIKQLLAQQIIQENNSNNMGLTNQQVLLLQEKNITLQHLIAIT